MPELDSLWKRNLAQLEPAWEQIFSILGDTATIFPLVGLGDDGLPGAASFKTRRRTSSGLEATVNWQATDGGPASWTNGNDYTTPDRWQGIVPIVDFDGVNDEGDTIDDPYWSNDDAGTNPWSVGAWIKIAAGTNGSILTKYDSGANEEWLFDLASGPDLRLFLKDESADVSCSRQTDAVLTEDVWHHVVAAYDSAGGASAADGITLYLDGAAIASTATNNGSYTAMEDKAAAVTIGARDGGSQFFTGKIAGGPHGPFFVLRDMSAGDGAAEIKRLYNMGRANLGLK